MQIKLGSILVAIILIVGKLNCQPINDNDDNLLINKNRDITLPKNNNNSDNNSSSSSNSNESNDSDLLNNSNSYNNKKTEVPLIFPDDTKNYKILPSNVTIIKKLLHQNSDSSEVADLNKPAPSETVPIINKPSDNNKTKSNDVLFDSKLLTGRNLKLNSSSLSTDTTTKADYLYEDDYSSGEEVNFNDEVENVQEKNTKKPKIELEEQFKRKDDIKTVEQLPVDIQDIDNPVQLPTVDETSPSKSVLFIVIVLVVAFIFTTIYLSLFIWRRKLESRYGMSERLMTNDDDVLQDDVHYRNQQQFGSSITVRENC